MAHINSLVYKTQVLFCLTLGLSGAKRRTVQQTHESGCEYFAWLYLIKGCLLVYVVWCLRAHSRPANEIIDLVVKKGNKFAWLIKWRGEERTEEKKLIMATLKVETQTSDGVHLMNLTQTSNSTNSHVNDDIIIPRIFFLYIIDSV